MKKSPREIRKEARVRQRKIRSAIFAVIVVGVLGLAGYYLKAAFFRPQPAPMAGHVIDVAVSMSGLRPPDIESSRALESPSQRMGAAGAWWRRGGDESPDPGDGLRECNGRCQDSSLANITCRHVEESRKPLLVIKIVNHSSQRFPRSSRHVFGRAIT